MNKNLKQSFFLTALFLTSLVNAGEYNPEKMHAVSNFALGIDPDARGDRFELIKNKPLNTDMVHNTNVISGAAVAGALGSNPVSPSGAGLANKITVGLDLLSIFSKGKEKIYAADKTKNSLFGKVYIKDSHENDFSAAADAIELLTNQVVQASKEILNVEASANLDLVKKQAAEYAQKNKRDRKIASFVELKLDDENILIVGIKTVAFVKPTIKNNQLGYDYAYENEFPYQLTMDFMLRNTVTKKFTGVLAELQNDEKYQAFFAKITEGGNVVLFSQNLKNTYYDGNHYVEAEVEKTNS